MKYSGLTAFGNSIQIFRTPISAEETPGIKLLTPIVCLPFEFSNQIWHRSTLGEQHIVEGHHTPEPTGQGLREPKFSRLFTLTLIDAQLPNLAG